MHLARKCSTQLCIWLIQNEKVRHVETHFRSRDYISVIYLYLGYLIVL